MSYKGLDLTMKYPQITNCVGQKLSQNSPPWPQEPSSTEPTESHLTQSNNISIKIYHYFTPSSPINSSSLLTETLTFIQLTCILLDFNNPPRTEQYKLQIPP